MCQTHIDKARNYVGSKFLAVERSHQQDISRFFAAENEPSEVNYGEFGDFDERVVNEAGANIQIARSRLAYRYFIMSLCSGLQTVFLLEHRTRIRGDLNLQSDVNC